MFRPLQKMGSREASGLHPIARIKSKSERSFVLPEKAAQPVGLGGAQASALTKQPRQGRKAQAVAQEASSPLALLDAFEWFEFYTRCSLRPRIEGLESTQSAPSRLIL